MASRPYEGIDLKSGGKSVIKYTHKMRELLRMLYGNAVIINTPLIKEASPSCCLAKKKSFVIAVGELCIEIQRTKV